MPKAGTIRLAGVVVVVVLKEARRTMRMAGATTILGARVVPRAARRKMVMGGMAAPGTTITGTGTIGVRSNKVTEAGVVRKAAKRAIRTAGAVRSRMLLLVAGKIWELGR
jgi:hypothetical protein